MNTKIKQLTLLATAGLLLAACGQGKKEESTQATTQATTTAPTTQVASNKQEATEALPKDGEATFKKEGKGKTTTLQYFFKDNIVYKQIGIYTYIPKESGKSEEEIVQYLNQSQELYKDVTGITSIVEKKDGQYIQTVTFDYQTIDWKELNRRAPKRFPATKPGPLKFNESAATLLKDGFVKQ